MLYIRGGEDMRKIDWKDVVRRAGKTFVQAFVASVGVCGEQIASIRDLESTKVILAPILIGGLAAGVSAVWNMAIKYFSGKAEEDK